MVDIGSYLHDLPHYDFSWKKISETSGAFDVNTSYVESIGMFAILLASLIFLVLHLPALVYMCISCCRPHKYRKVEYSRNSTHGRHFGVCFIAIIVVASSGFGLYSDIDLHSNIDDTVNDVLHEEQLFTSTVDFINEWSTNISYFRTHSLRNFIDYCTFNSSCKNAVNDATALSDGLLQVSNTWNSIKYSLPTFDDEVSYAHDVGHYNDIHRIAILSSFAVCIVFAFTLIVLSRLNRTRAMLLAITCFLLTVVGTIGVSTFFAGNVAAADICYNTTGFIENQITNDYLDYYLQCDNSTSPFNNDLIAGYAAFLEAQSKANSIKMEVEPGVNTTFINVAVNSFADSFATLAGRVDCYTPNQIYKDGVHKSCDEGMETAFFKVFVPALTNCVLLMIICFMLIAATRNFKTVEYYGEEARPLLATNRSSVNDETACKICYEGSQNILLEPCHHVLCSNCASKVTICPFCRVPIASRNVIFL